MRTVTAEDHFLLRDGLTRLLSAYGHQVAAGNGDDLLNAIRGHQPDAAVAGVRTPPGFTGALQRAAGGGTVMDPEVIARLPAHNAGPGGAPAGQLSPREREVLKPTAGAAPAPRPPSACSSPNGPSPSTPPRSSAG